MPRGKAASSSGVKGAKVSKPAPSSTRRGSGRIAAIRQAADREVLSDRTNHLETKKHGGKNTKLAMVSATADDSIMTEDSDIHDYRPAAAPAPAIAPKRGRPPKAAKPAAVPENIDDDDDDDNHDDLSDEPPRSKRGRRTGSVQPRSRKVEAQEPEESMDVIDLDAEMAVDVEEEEVVQPKRPAAAAARRTAAAAPSSSDSAPESDTALRRRLGDATLKCESLETKYRDLREIGVKEAERNFDRLKKQGEDRASAAKELIATLKSELMEQSAHAREGERHKKQLDESEARAAKLQAKVAELTTSLADAKAEIRALSSKMTALKSGAGDIGGKVPGSATKSGASGNAAWNMSGEGAQRAQMKEDLYGDLTGLIVRGVKKDGADEAFDCIQTGRNGTLHFKLVCTTDNTSDGYEETQCVYLPQLDGSRDRELIELLPDFLVEEITFPRPQASKFYSRLLKSLTERPE